MRLLARLALLCSALLLTCALVPPTLAAQSGAIGIRGDVNRDGSVTAVDALAVLSHVVGKPLPAAYTTTLDGDADGNGEVTALDALVILGYAVGKDVARYPVGKRVLSGRVGREGGTVVSRPDSIRLDVPDGALSSATLLTVRPAEGLSAAAGVLPGTALEVGPEGTAFERPARLTLRVDAAALPAGTAAEGLSIHRRVGDAWEEVPGGSVDVAAGTVFAPIAGPGTYAVRVGAPAGLRLVKEAGDGQTGVAGRPPMDFLAVRLVGPSGRGVRGVELVWTVTEGGGSVRPLEARTDSAGRVRAVLTLGAAPGTNRVRVSAPGAEPVTFSVLGVADAPATVAVVAGADQTATAGSAVATPPAVRVTDSAGSPVVDAAVTFAVATGGGSVTGGAVRTDAGGVATLGSWTLGTTAGPNTLSATVQGGPAATIAATGLPGAAAAISVRAGDGGTAAVATTRVLEARVVDIHGNGVPGVAVAWAVVAGGGSLSAPGSVTGADGVASVVWTFGGTTGAQSVTASAAGLAGSPLTFAASTTPAAASQLALATQPSAVARSGVALAAQPVAQLRDAFGNAVPQAGVAVTAAIASGGGTLGGTVTAITDAGGAATFTDLAVSGPVGQRTLSFSAAGLAGATSGAIDLAAGTPAGLAIAAGDGQTAVAGSPVATAPAVRVTDASGNPVPGVGVAFGAGSGGGSVAGAAATTDAGGVAAAGSWTLGPVVGANTLTASATGLTPVMFTATGVAGPAAGISIRAGDGGSAAVASTRLLEVKVVDANGNPVRGSTVAWAVAAGAGTLSAPSSATDSAGVASVTWTLGTTAGPQSATATSAGLAGSPLTFTVAATPAPAARLAVAAQPSASARSGIAFLTQPVVQIQDAHGNAVAQGGTVVTASVVSGGGALGGTPTATTDAAGRATFAGLSVSGTAGAYTLGFSASGLADAASGTIVLGAGNPAVLVVATQPSATARSGIAFPVQPAVQLQDASGNAVSQGGVVVTASIASGGGTLGGTATAATDADGRATFAGLAVSGPVGQRTLAFAAAGLTGATSAAVDVTAGAPASLSIATQPSSSAQSGIAFPQQPVLQLRDADGNPVAQPGVAVTATVASGTGTLGGTATAATDAAGRAAFTDLAVSGAVGAYTLGFASPGLAAATSGTVSLAAGAPASLAVQAGNGQTATAGAQVAAAPSVVVRDASSNPVPGVGVTFAVASGGGSVTGATATSDASGVATVGSWTLGTTAGANTLTASATGLTAATFTATGVAGPAASISIQSGDGGSATVASTRVLEVKVVDANGNPVGGHTVAWAVGTGGGSLSAPASTTSAAGVAAATWTLGTAAGAQTAVATSAGLAGSPLTFTASATAAAAAAGSSTLAASPTSITADGTSASTLVVQLRDPYGNNLGAGAGTVALSTTGGTLGAVADNGNGTYTATLTAPTTTGTATVSGTLNGSPLAGTATVAFAPGAPARYTVAPSAATPVAGSTVTVTAQLVDANGNAVPAAGRTVTWSSAGGGSFASPTSATDAAGIASVVFTTSTTSGTTHTVTADDGSVNGTSGSVVTQVGAPAGIVKSGADGVSLAAGSAVTPLPAVRVVDAGGNGVPGVAVTFAVTAGGGSVTGETGTTDATGLATVGSWTLGTTAGPNTLSATAGSLGASFSVTGTAGPASAAGTQVTTANAALTAGSVTTVTVRVTDQYGNDVGTGGATVAIVSDLGTVGAVTDNGNGTYTADLAHTGTNGTATVTGMLNGAAITDNAQVTFQAGGIQRTWTGLAGSSWNTAGSWSPRGTPTTSDTIVIGGGGTQPQVTDADKTILRLVMTSAGGTLDLGGFRLVVTGDAVASGGTVSNGTVEMSGSARTIQGTFPGLRVTGGIAAGGSTTANGAVTVANGSLTVSNQTLTIRGQ